MIWILIKESRLVLCFVFIIYYLLREGGIDSLRIFEFAKNVLHNSLVLLSIIAPKKENLSLSL